MRIEKTAKLKKNAYKKLYYFDSARDAFKELLKFYKNKEEYSLLLPGYIGISPNEGSGIYDPVVDTDISHRFYKIDENLQIDINDFEKKIQSGLERKIVLLVHYFGYPDYEITSVIKLCKKYDAIVIEDAAHALYTDFIDHKCGIYGDFVLYSLHKMLPLSQGGLLKVNNNESGFEWDDSKITRYPLFDYDLYQIAVKRKRNAKIWNELLLEEDGVEIMRSYSDDTTPQTFPIKVKNYDRNQLYFKLNELGFGAVSLYHTMINQIKEENLEEAIYLSQHIINLPVHQDTNEQQIKEMCEALLRIIKEQK